MAQKKYPSLGRGLDALISTDTVKTEGSSSISEIAINQIKANPNQPRREFDTEALQELADSIKEIGIIQPITLRKMDDGTYQIIAGERRFRASQLAGLTTVPAYIRTADDENVMEMALVENIQREDLNSMEIALAYQHLLEEYSLTQEKLSERVGKKPAQTTGTNPNGTQEPRIGYGARSCTARIGKPRRTDTAIPRHTNLRILSAQSRRHRQEKKGEEFHIEGWQDPCKRLRHTEKAPCQLLPN